MSWKSPYSHDENVNAVRRILLELISLIILVKSRDSSVGVVTTLRAGRSGFWGSISGGGCEFFSSPPRLERPPIQWISGALCRVVKRPCREADNSRPSSAEVKEWVKLYLHSPDTYSWRCAQLKKKFFREASKFWSSSVCSSFHPPVTSSEGISKSFRI
jgi:hypothetical protein